MVTRIYKKIKSWMVFNPHKLFKEERDLVNQPFFFEGNNGKAILLIHGWTTTPYEIRRLGYYLNEMGYTVSAPLLKGHGTVPKDLEKVKWIEWLDQIKKEYERLEEKYEKVFVGGTSIGSSLATVLAYQRKSVAGLVLMAMPYKIKFEKIAKAYSQFMMIFKKYNKKVYPPSFGSKNTITRLIAYQSYPLKSTIEAIDLVATARDVIPAIKQPCLIIQSSADHIVYRKSASEIYNAIASKDKSVKYIKKAYHTFISDIKNEHVFEDILQFINKH